MKAQEIHAVVKTYALPPFEVRVIRNFTSQCALVAHGVIVYASADHRKSEHAARLLNEALQPVGRTR